MPYHIVGYTPDLDSQIAQLHKHLGGDGPTQNATYLKWKCAENPYLDEPLLYIALCAGLVVGMRGMFGMLWQVDDDNSRHLLPYADDMVVDPEHRNRGLVSQIMRAAFDDLARRGFPTAISLSAGPVTYVASLALGWRSAGSFEPLRLDEPPQPGPSRARALAARVPWLRRFAGIARRQFARGPFRNLDREGHAHPGGISLSHIPRCEAMAELITRLPWDGRIRHVRDARYFAWRFRNPRHEYRFLFAGGESLQGYLVLRRPLSERGNLAPVGTSIGRRRMNSCAAICSPPRCVGGVSRESKRGWQAPGLLPVRSSSCTVSRWNPIVSGCGIRGSWCAR